jgi:hypothetical protein
MRGAGFFRVFFSIGDKPDRNRTDVSSTPSMLVLAALYPNSKTNLWIARLPHTFLGECGSIEYERL